MWQISELSPHFLYCEDISPHLNYLVIVVCFKVKFTFLEDVYNLLKTESLLIELNLEALYKGVHLTLESYISKLLLDKVKDFYWRLSE